MTPGPGQQRFALTPSLPANLIVKRPVPEDYGLTEQEARYVRHEMESRALAIGARIAFIGTAAICIYTAVTEGLLIAILVTISAGLFILLFGSIIMASAAEWWIAKQDPRVTRLQEYQAETARYIQQERRLAGQNALPRDIQRIVDGEASASEARRTISKYIGHNDW